MLKILTILLLCGLLPFQEAEAQEGSTVTAMVNLDEILKPLTETLKRLLNVVIGGNPLGGSQGSSTGGTLDTQKGLLKGILGRRRRDLLGGVLGGNKGGLLEGKDGLLGGLLEGKDGLLGSLLEGKDGLLGGLLGGKNGLLGSVLNLLNLKIGKMDLLDIKLDTLPEGGPQLRIRLNLELLGTSRSSKPLVHVLVDIKLSLRVVQDENGVSKLVIENCLTDPVHIELLSGTLLGNLDGDLSKLLNDLLPGVLCPVGQLVTNVLNTLLATLKSLLAVGNVGSVLYTPAGPPSFQDGHMLQHLIVNLVDNNGNTIKQGPAEMAAPPPVTDHTSKLLLSSSVLRPLLELLVKNGQFDADIIQQTVSGLLPANTTLVIRLQIRDTPVISMENEKIMVTLKATLEVLAQNRSDLTLIAQLVADIKLAVQINVSGTKLRLFVALESLDLRLVSSNIGNIDVERLKDWLMKILHTKYLPLINGALDKAALPLPKIMDLGYPDGPTSIHGNNIVAPLTPKLP